jgi:selenocysteine-specific translation elongation factor
MSRIVWETQKEEGIRMLKTQGNQVQKGQAGNRHTINFPE